MKKDQVIAELKKLGVESSNGKYKKSDIRKVLATLVTADCGNKECPGFFVDDISKTIHKCDDCGLFESDKAASNYLRNYLRKKGSDLLPEKPAVFASAEETCEEFSSGLENHYFFDSLVDEQYWADDFKAESYFEMLKNEAKKKNIKLSDADDFDYETYYWELYKASEKGLS